MDNINLEPRYSTNEVPGRCIKCLAEENLNNCLLELLRSGGEDSKLAQRYEMLITFLKSPEAHKLRDESEKYLAEGKEVTVSIDFKKGKPKYKLRVNK